MKALQDPTITLMVYEPVNEQAYDEPSAVPYVCEVQFYWPECGCVATIGGVINKTADLQGWNARTFVEVPAYTAETYADTPDWYEEWEYLQATFDQAITETNLFESLWSNL